MAVAAFALVFSVLIVRPSGFAARQVTGEVGGRSHSTDAEYALNVVRMDADARLRWFEHTLGDCGDASNRGDFRFVIYAEDPLRRLPGWQRDRVEVDLHDPRLARRRRHDPRARLRRIVGHKGHLMGRVF